MTKCKAAFISLAILLLSVPLRAQEAAGPDAHAAQNQKDGEVFRSPLASPTEPGALFRYTADSRLDFGLALPLSLCEVEGGRSSWELTLRPGFVSRLIDEQNRLSFLAADFRLGLALAYRNGNWSARTEFFHLSSHRGADLEAAGTPQFSFSRETLQTLVAYGRPASWRIYLGPSFVVRTHPDVGRWTAQAGFEFFPALFVRSHARPYVAADFQTREEQHWNANASVEPGVMFTSSNGRPVARLAFWMYRGQVPFGQFFREKEKQIGVHFSIEIGASARSLISRK